MTVEVVFTRDASSGRIHKRYRDSDTGHLSSFEGDNLDQAGKYEVIGQDILADADARALCENCFPRTDVVAHG